VERQSNITVTGADLYDTAAGIAIGVKSTKLSQAAPSNSCWGQITAATSLGTGTDQWCYDWQAMKQTSTVDTAQTWAVDSWPSDQTGKAHGASGYHLYAWNSLEWMNSFVAGNTAAITGATPGMAGNGVNMAHLTTNFPTMLLVPVPIGAIVRIEQVNGVYVFEYTNAIDGTCS
jgi:hypothetical protein